MARKIILAFLVLIAILLVAGVVFMFQTRSRSPESEVVINQNGLTISLSYSRPYKKGRVIFGQLVPYGKTWRTGANKPTTFETNKPLRIGEQMLKPGKYSLWTVPGEREWLVVFNGTIPYWGIDVMNKWQASRDPDHDVLVVEVPVVWTQKEFEQFTISLEETDDTIEMVMAWDKVLVSVPMIVSEQEL